MCSGEMWGCGSTGQHKGEDELAMMHSADLLIIPEHSVESKEPGTTTPVVPLLLLIFRIEEVEVKTLSN